MKLIKSLFAPWHNWRYLRAVCKDAGISYQDLSSHCVYYKMTLTEMVAYHEFFGRLPHPDYVTVIRHIGVDNLINEIKKQQGLEPVKH